MSPIGLWRNSTPYFGAAALCTTNIDDFRAPLKSVPSLSLHNLSCACFGLSRLVVIWYFPHHKSCDTPHPVSYKIIFGSLPPLYCIILERPLMKSRFLYLYVSGCNPKKIRNVLHRVRSDIQRIRNVMHGNRKIISDMLLTEYKESYECYTGYEECSTGYQECFTGYEECSTGYQEYSTWYQECYTGYQECCWDTLSLECYWNFIPLVSN